MTYNILLVDDDATQAQIIEQVIHDRMHYNTQLVKNGQDAINVLTSNDSSGIDLVLLDLSMPGIDGVQVLNAVKPVKPNLPIIVRTGYDDIDLAVEAMKAGATDFVKKFDSPDRLKKCIDKALRLSVLNDEMSLMKMHKKGQMSFSSIIGQSPAVRDMVALGEKVSKSDIPVLLEGESGSGKELMARAIHAASSRAESPFIAVNCGAIPDNLVESILFGHEKGAFTGAVYKTFGKFREADGGTIFLDEIGELPLDVQVKLLRVLQDGEIDPVGGNKPLKVNVRVISATNKNLSEEVGAGKFREDLFYRLNVFPIAVPPLRQRSGDIAQLVQHYVRSFAASESKVIKGINPDAEQMLCHYAWPGNIRQLKNTVYRAIVLCEGDMLRKEDFPQVVIDMEHAGPTTGGVPAAVSRLGDAARLLLEENKQDLRKLGDIEKDIILMALDFYQGHMSEVARKLGIGRSTLYRKLEEYGIEAGEGQKS